MSNETETAPVASAEAIDVFALRRAARGRTWVCPGAGFEFLGRKRAARFAYAASLGTMLAALLTALMPTAALAWTTAALLVLGTFLFVVEITATYTAWPAAAPPPSRRYLGRAALLAAATAAFGVVAVTQYRLVEIRGGGMEPTVSEGRRILYRRGVWDADLKSGTLILFRLGEGTKFAEPGVVMLGRILAGPGDKLKIRDGFYYVNDVIASRVTGLGSLPPTLAVPRHPRDTFVPADRYFVVQDSIDEGLDSRVLSWADHDRIESATLLTFDQGPLPHRLK